MFLFTAEFCCQIESDVFYHKELLTNKTNDKLDYFLSHSNNLLIANVILRRLQIKLSNEF